MADELYHYGIKGMKWGIRKKRQPSLKVDLKKQQLILESKTKNGAPIRGIQSTANPISKFLAKHNINLQKTNRLN